ncbi:1-phosphofructokinase family hexose kinase [Corynebacterium epidermidicanis]|uniref:Hexose kinase, 1-phosphofructokinase family n=1 Tax=Corynebacterium epidermidicanis TaxID=1050174 RepID=A0A0G3GQ42_9CORY|nr:1-phosphofructokinase family hexose kinase [Corynebacterium epidermidicanis]AKK03331.1 hexose kinase, 1-phosphofructokinase family [Corynebacterium epidermidicanis]
MILTFTPNPSIDSTLSLAQPLDRGAVQRASAVSRVAGGKGVNVAVATHRAGLKTLAVFPAPTDDAFLRLMSHSGAPFEHIHNEGTVRTNTTIMEIDGTTTKLNGPGASLSAVARKRCETRLGALCVAADWVVLAGSLPPDAPLDWYTQLTALVRDHNPAAHVAIDASDAPLQSVADNLETVAPALLKPNAFELGVLAGIDGHWLEEQATAGIFTDVVAAADGLVKRGVRYVLVTLGQAGAVLVTHQRALHARPPEIDVLSTVGAGDSALAGFLLGLSHNFDEGQALSTAVAYGTAATTLPGTQIPFPAIVHPELVHLSDISDQLPRGSR